MSSLTSLVTAHGPIKPGTKGLDVKALQVALQQAGYRVDADQDYGPRTLMVVKQFETQHGLPPDGVVGAREAALLDLPHSTLVEVATPMIAKTGWPHDDTASLISYYGDPRPDLDRWKAQNVTTVPCPFPLYYAGSLWPHPIPIHKKCALALASALSRIWDAAGKDPHSPILVHVRNYSGSGNLRPVRGADSSRISTHGFWAAIDYDSEHLPLGVGIPASAMPREVVDAYLQTGAFWGNNYTGRKDPMHFQWAHE